MGMGEAWAGLNPNIKRFVAVGGVVGIVGTLMYVVMPDGDSYRRSSQQPIEHLLTDQDTSKVTLQGLAAKIDALRTGNSKLQRQVDQLRADQKELAKDKGPSRMMQKEMADLRSRLQNVDRKNQAVLARIDELEENGLEMNVDLLESYASKSSFGSGYAGMGNGMMMPGQIPVIPAMTPARDIPTGEAQVLSEESLGIKKDDDEVADGELKISASAEEFFKKAPNPSSIYDQNSTMSSGTASGRAATAPTLKVRSIASGDTENSAVSRKAKEVSVVREKEESEQNSGDEPGTYLPAGSIVEAVVIAGMDAPTAGAAKRDPFPALMRFKKEAILPNRYTADIRECFLIVSGYGSMSSERAYLRGETLSCVRDDGGVLETRFDAFAVGEDGKTGVRGRLVTKAGALVGKAMLAGFGQGLAKALDVSVVPTISTGRNTDEDVQYQNVFSTESMRSGAVGGVSTAMEKVAEYYLDMADEMTPVIEVDAGRVISFVVNRGVKLKTR